MTHAAGQEQVAGQLALTGQNATRADNVFKSLAVEDRMGRGWTVDNDM
jgi:hypothetical protein